MKNRTMKIRLRRGEEPVEFTAESRFLMGLSSRSEVPPGENCVIKVDFQVPGLITTLLVDRETAAHFELYDMRVGKNSCFCTVDPVPLFPFVTDVDGYPETGEIDLTHERLRELLDLERVQLGQEFSLTVTNTSDVPRRFKCAGYLQVLSLDSYVPSDMGKLLDSHAA